MDKYLVYVKTPIGDEAVRQSTHVVKRNLRMVLVQVDGKLSVAELSTKIGNSQLVEAALRELFGKRVSEKQNLTRRHRFRIFHHLGQHLCAQLMLVILKRWPVIFQDSVKLRHLIRLSATCRQELLHR